MVASAKHVSKRSVQCCAPPWENLFVMVVRDARSGFQTGRLEQKASKKSPKKCLGKRNKEALYCQWALVSFWFGTRALLLCKYSAYIRVNKYLLSRRNRIKLGKYLRLGCGLKLFCECSST